MYTLSTSHFEYAWHEGGLQEELLNGGAEGLVERGVGSDNGLLQVVQPGEVGLYVPESVGRGRMVHRSAPTGVVHTEEEMRTVTTITIG